MARAPQFLEPAKIEGLGERYKVHPGPYALTEVDLNRIFPGISGVTAEPLIEDFVKGDADPPNLSLLCRLVSYLQPQNVLEVGTFRGKTTYNLAAYSPHNARIITVDLPEECRTGEKLGYGTDLVYLQKKEDIGILFKNSPQNSKIIQIFGDSTSEKCYGEIDGILTLDETIDFAFIDAAHDYCSVKHNFEELVLPRLSENGVVVFEDYGNLATHVGVSHYLQRKAHDDGFVFYWHAPLEEKTTCVLFINVPQSKDYAWDIPK